MNDMDPVTPERRDRTNDYLKAALAVLLLILVVMIIAITVGNDPGDTATANLSGSSQAAVAEPIAPPPVNVAPGDMAQQGSPPPMQMPDPRFGPIPQRLQGYWIDSGVDRERLQLVEGLNSALAIEMGAMPGDLDTALAQQIGGLDRSNCRNPDPSAGPLRLTGNMIHIGGATAQLASIDTNFHGGRLSIDMVFRFTDAALRLVVEERDGTFVLATLQDNTGGGDIYDTRNPTRRQLLLLRCDPSQVRVGF